MLSKVSHFILFQLVLLNLLVMNTQVRSPLSQTLYENKFKNEKKVEIYIVGFRDQNFQLFDK